MCIRDRRFVNQAFREVLTRPETLFWNVFEKNEFQVIDITASSMEETLPRMYRELMPSKFYKKIVVKDGEVCLLYFDNRLERTLSPGTYFFWNYGREVSGKIFDLKFKQLEISGQEILTADKVGVRLKDVYKRQGNFYGGRRNRGGGDAGAGVCLGQ